MITATALPDLPAIEKQREQEIEEARVIQWAMLPLETFRTDSVVVSHEFQPVTDVGGDYLDYFALAEGTLGLSIGDVSGKGLPAALYAALAIGTLRGVHKTGLYPARVTGLLNERLCLRGIPGRHSALQYAVFYPATGEMGSPLDSEPPGLAGANLSGHSKLHEQLPAMGRHDRGAVSLFATIAAVLRWLLNEHFAFDSI
jgi:hypothetical protein